MVLPKRKSPRLKGYNYSQNGAYFVTICTYERKCVLSRIVAEYSRNVGEGLRALPQNIMMPIGNEIEKSIQFINKNYTSVHVDKYVIMPNHIHLIVVLNDSGGYGNPPLQNIIGQLKSYTTDKFGNVLWQRSYHDHIIRGEEDYKKIWDYIDTNVTRWKEDCFYNKETEQ